MRQILAMREEITLRNDATTTFVKMILDKCEWQGEFFLFYIASEEEMIREERRSRKGRGESCRSKTKRRTNA